MDSLEPLNIGSVIEDGEGSAWVRTCPGVRQPWTRPWVGPNGEWRRFNEIVGPVTAFHEGLPGYEYSWVRDRA